jgi:hypothetical protein
MILGQICKSISTAPASVATNGTASAGPFEVGGFGQVVLKGVLPRATSTTVTDDKWASFGVYAADTTTFATTIPVVGLIGATATGTSVFLLGTGHQDTSFGGVTDVSVDGNRHKYLFVQWGVASTSYNTATFHVDAYQAAQAPSSAAESGCNAIGSGVVGGSGI